MARKSARIQKTKDPNCYLTTCEYKRMRGLTPLAKCVYVELRGLMEPNGTVGTSTDSQISMSKFRELLREDGGQGKKSKMPKTGQITWCFKKLKDNRLLDLSRYNSKDMDKMILFLPIAEPYGEFRPPDVIRKSNTCPHSPQC